MKNFIAFSNIAFLFLILSCTQHIKETKGTKSPVESAVVFNQLKIDTSSTTVWKTILSDTTFGYIIRHEVPHNHTIGTSEYRSAQDYNIVLTTSGKLLQFTARNTDFDFYLTKSDSGYTVQSSRESDYLYDKQP